ncbi:MAG: hypothetical protein E4H09_03215, partial [Spirochaetales bacterium]
GGCHDGLEAQGVNQNEGAESTIAWLLSLLAVMRHRGKASRRVVIEPPASEPQPARERVHR